MALSQPCSDIHHKQQQQQQQQQQHHCLRSFIPLSMRTAATSPSRPKSAAFCDESSSAKELCAAAAAVGSALESALAVAGKSAGCLAEWALRVCDDSKYESFW
jgi:hypothetical protein